MISAENQCSDAEVALCGNNTSCSRPASGPICACRIGFQNATGLCKGQNIQFVYLD